MEFWEMLMTPVHDLLLWLIHRLTWLFSLRRRELKTLIKWNVTKSKKDTKGILNLIKNLTTSVCGSPGEKPPVSSLRWNQWHNYPVYLLRSKSKSYGNHLWHLSLYQPVVMINREVLEWPKSSDFTTWFVPCVSLYGGKQDQKCTEMLL